MLEKEIIITTKEILKEKTLAILTNLQRDANLILLLSFEDEGQV